MAHPLPSPTTRGRRYSQHQISASVTSIPRSAHTFDDSTVSSRQKRRMKKTTTSSSTPSSGTTSRELSRRPASAKMQRQDSGYESLDSGASKSPSEAYRRRKSSVSSSSYTSSGYSQSHSSSHHRRHHGSHHHQHHQPLPPMPRVKRSSTAGSHSSQGSRARRNQSLHLSQSQEQHQQQQLMANSYFQFPNPEFNGESAIANDDEEEAEAEDSVAARRPPLPQTMQYWTSDDTRRLEYAAIDAASHGVKGWVRRNLVPGCMVPKDGGHLDFDDDTGSVRRYRLDLDEEDDGNSSLGDCGAEKSGDKKGRWRWGKKVQ